MGKINIGLTDEQRNAVIGLLNADLADLYLLLIKTKKYHWDVVGPQFRSLHELWEEHYQSLTTNIDACAERIRMLGGFPLGTAEGFLKEATIKEHPGDLPAADEMVRRLVEDHEMIIRKLRDHINKCSETYGDEGTSGFLTDLLEEHEEMAWMLRSFIEGQIFEPNGNPSNVSSKSTVAAN